SSMCISQYFLQVVRLVHGELANPNLQLVVAAVFSRGKSTRNFLNDAHAFRIVDRAMNDRANPATRNWGATWLGLFVALFGILIVRAAVYAFFPPYSFPAAARRESLSWVCA